ncbi:MAG: hypothetical protein JEY91_05645, partial [Spirochaetaceae bacterium]|nr:hypothetical protein [Spirochaetaceae bacterium]
MTDKLYQFAEIDLFLQYYSPRTPYGKREKMNRTFYRDSDSLSTIFELIDHAGNFIKTNPHKADKIEYHLGRIPELWETLKTPQVNSEIFNVKKFLHNYLLISTLLDKKTASLFSFSFSSIELLNKLGYRKDQEETFYLNDSCSPELKKIRADLRDLNRELEKIKEQRIGIIKEKTGLDFRFHDFLVIREEA